MIWFLAFHSLRQRPLRTFLTALGITVAVGSTVVFLSLGEGLRQVFGTQIGNIGPELQVSFGPFDTTLFTAVPELPLHYREALLAEEARFGIREVVPLLFFLRGGLTPSTSFMFQGLPTDQNLAEIYGGFTVLEGRGLNAEDRDAQVAVVGEQVAERSQLSLGSVLRLNPGTSFEIVGIVKSTGGLIDNAVLVPLRALQAAIDIEDRVSFFAVKLAEPARAAEVAEALSERYPNLSFQTQADVLGVIEQGIRVSDVVRLGISVIALVVGAIAVANTVLMSVFERTREFGVIRALGAKPGFLFGLVLSEAIILSLIGAGFGVLLGQGGIALVNRVAENLIGLEVAALTLRLVFFAVAIAITMGLVSGLLPAARAARIPIAVAMARE